MPNGKSSKRDDRRRRPAPTSWSAAGGLGPARSSAGSRAPHRERCAGRSRTRVVPVPHPLPRRGAIGPDRRQNGSSPHRNRAGASPSRGLIGSPSRSPEPGRRSIATRQASEATVRVARGAGVPQRQRVGVGSGSPTWMRSAADGYVRATGGHTDTARGGWGRGAPPRCTSAAVGEPPCPAGVHVGTSLLASRRDQEPRRELHSQRT